MSPGLRLRLRPPPLLTRKGLPTTTGHGFGDEKLARGWGWPYGGRKKTPAGAGVKVSTGNVEVCQGVKLARMERRLKVRSPVARMYQAPGAGAGTWMVSLLPGRVER